MDLISLSRVVLTILEIGLKNNRPCILLFYVHHVIIHIFNHSRQK